MWQYFWIFHGDNLLESENTKCRNHPKVQRNLKNNSSSVIQNPPARGEIIPRVRSTLILLHAGQTCSGKPSSAFSLDASRQDLGGLGSRRRTRLAVNHLYHNCPQTAVSSLSTPWAGRYCRYQSVGFLSNGNFQVWVSTDNWSLRCSRQDTWLQELSPELWHKHLYIQSIRSRPDSRWASTFPI